MRVLIISAAFPPHRSGEATNAYFLAQQMAARGVDVHVLTNVGNTRDAGPGVVVHPLMRKWTWAERGRLVRFMRRCRPDAILMLYIGWTYNYQFMPTFLPTIAKRALPGVRFVTRFENTMGADPGKTSMVERALRKAAASRDALGNVNYGFGTLLRDSDRIIALSSTHARRLAMLSADVVSKTATIPPAPNMAMSPASHESRREGRVRLGLGDDDFVVSFLGYFHPQKGIDLLLKAFASVRQRCDDVRLVLMGGAIDPSSGNAPSHTAELQTLAKRMGVDDAVCWTGPYSCDTTDASLFLRASDVCALPFLKGVHLNNSSFSSSVAHGLPVITTSGDDLETPLCHEENVYLCQAGSVESLSEAIMRLRNDAGLRKNIAEGAGRLANQCFAWDTMVERTMSLLTEGCVRQSQRISAGPRCA